MSEVLAEITSQVKGFLDGDRTDVERTLIRSTTIESSGANYSIEQSRFLNDQDTQIVRAKGALALASTVWFNDVDFIRSPGEDYNPRRLILEATYPVSYFDERPASGHFISESDEPEGSWAYQYGSLSGFGTAEKITDWEFSFVAPEARSITYLRYPQDTDSLHTYNERYKQYLKALDDSDPTLLYRRAWDRSFSSEKQSSPLVIGGLSLAGLSLDDTIKQGSVPLESPIRSTELLLRYDPPQNGNTLKLIGIAEGETFAQDFWDGGNNSVEVSNKVLGTALKLVQNLRH